MSTTITPELKEDLEAALQRHAAWWSCDVIDRACIQVTAPRNRPAPPLPPPRDLEQLWTDVDYAMEALERHMAHTFFGGDALPIYHVNIGPDAFAAFFGAELELLPDTTWVRPMIHTWDPAPELQLDPDNRWWQLQMGLAREALARSRGRWMVGFPDTHSGPDGLSALRGREALCIDLYDHPAEVDAAMLPIRRGGRALYDAYFELLRPEIGGSSSGWLHAWGPGRYNVIQCDLIALISPRTFKRFFFDWFVEELSWFDSVVWHLDGPECIPHLDYLLEEPKIAAIQWVPGAGRAPISEWIPLLKRIQAAGKGLHLSVEAREVEILMRELSSRGLMLATGVRSEEEAHEMVRDVARWTHD